MAWLSHAFISMRFNQTTHEPRSMMNVGSLTVSLAAFGVMGGVGLSDLTISPPPGDASSGKTIYSSLCARCHGVDGTGHGMMSFTPPVADLTSPAVQNKLDAGLFKRIHEGKPNTAMGAWRSALSDEEIWDVL